jgi:hypothetical protein
MLRKYKVDFEISVDQIWFDDGLDAKTLARRIKEELPSKLCPYADSSELFISKLNIKKL